MQGEADEQVLICLSDMKSGYHHVPIHEGDWTWMAIVIDGEYFAFPAMTFGMSCAVEVYCSIEGEKHRCLRRLGLSLVQYIDDRASPYHTVPHALFCETWIIRLVTALGGFLSFGELTFVRGEGDVLEGTAMAAHARGVSGVPRRHSHPHRPGPGQEGEDVSIAVRRVAGKGGHLSEGQGALYRVVGVFYASSGSVPAVPQANVRGAHWNHLVGRTVRHAKEERDVITMYRDNIQTWNGAGGRADQSS